MLKIKLYPLYILKKARQFVEAAVCILQAAAFSNAIALDIDLIHHKTLNFSILVSSLKWPKYNSCGALVPTVSST